MLSLMFGIIIVMALMIFIVLYAMHKRSRELESLMIDNTKALLREMDSLKEKIRKWEE